MVVNMKKTVNSKEDTKKVKNTKKVNNKNNTKKKEMWKKIIMVIIVLIIVLAGIGAGLIFGMAGKYAITKKDLIIDYSNSTVVDTDGNVLAVLSGKENRKIVM